MTWRMTFRSEGPLELPGFAPSFLGEVFALRYDFAPNPYEGKRAVPIYEYRCLECGFQDEFLQKVSEPPKTVCPSCGKESFKKLVSAAGFQLKGSGWYVTDFRNSGGKPPAGGAAGAKAKEKDKSEGAKGEGSQSEAGTKSEPEGSSAGATEAKKEAAAA